VTSRQDRSVDLLLELGRPMARRTRGELLQQALLAALALVDADATVVAAPSRKRGDRLAVHAGSTAPATLKLQPEGSEVLRMFGQSCEPLLIPDLQDQPGIAASDGCPGVDLGPALFTPLRQRNTDLGYLAAYRRRGRARFTANDSRLLLLLATWASSALENLRLSTGTQRRAVTDDLTDVYNHRFVKAALERELRRASRFAQELSLVVVGIDRPALHEAEQGEVQGSLLLRELASVLSQQVRSFDLLGRMSEDEFMLILPQTGREGAAEVAGRMRAAVEAQRFSSAAAGTITVSLGVAAFPHDAAAIGDLEAAAGRALQLARQRGSNCVATLAREAA